MASISGATTIWNAPNYVGQMYVTGPFSKTPFLNMIGVQAGIIPSENSVSAIEATLDPSVSIVDSLLFNLSQTSSLNPPSQPEISENDSLTAPTPTTYARSHNTNTCQLFREPVSVSYLKQSVTGMVKASTGTGQVHITGTRVLNELDTQIDMHLRQMKANMEFTFLRGTYQEATSESVPAKTRGIIEACLLNTENAGSSELSKTHLNLVLKSMFDNGAPLENVVILVNSTQKMKLSTLYAYAPVDRNYGGVAVNQIETDFAILGVVLSQNIPQDTLLIVDVNYCRPVFMPVPGKGVLFYEELSRVGAGERGELYSQAGIDYASETFHGKITNLAV